MSKTSEISVHRPYEDISAGLIGTTLVALGLTIFTETSLLTGGTAGLALLLQYATGTEFWMLFLLLNLPFYLLSISRLGRKLTIRTFLAVLLLSFLSRLTPTWIGIDYLDPIYAAVVGGALMGVGLLILFRHRTTLGGINVLALYAQERYGLRAGYVLLAVDALILFAALFIIDQDKVVLSVLGTAMLNLVIAINHKPGRYVGVS